MTASAVAHCSPARHRQVGTMLQDQDPARDSPLESYKHRPGISRRYRTPQSLDNYKAKRTKKQGFKPLPHPDMLSTMYKTRYLYLVIKWLNHPAGQVFHSA